MLLWFGFNHGLKRLLIFVVCGIFARSVPITLPSNEKEMFELNTFYDGGRYSTSSTIYPAEACVDWIQRFVAGQPSRSL
jgi:hypothetical protein